MITCFGAASPVNTMPNGAASEVGAIGSDGMLGIPRGRVSTVMAKLQKAGMVRYSRGHVAILNRAALQIRACKCYEVSRMEFDNMLGDTLKNPRTDEANCRVGKAGQRASRKTSPILFAL